LLLMNEDPRSINVAYVDVEQLELFGQYLNKQLKLAFGNDTTVTTGVFVSASSNQERENF